MASLSGIKYVVFDRIVGRGGTRHGRVGAFDGRDGVATWSRRCLGDVGARRSSIVSLSAGDSRGLQAGGTRAPSCCGAVALSLSSTRRQLAPRFRRSLHPAQGSCWRSQPRCCVVGSFDRVTAVADRHELPELEDRGVGRSRGKTRGLTDPQVSWAAEATSGGQARGRAAEARVRGDRRRRLEGAETIDGGSPRERHDARSSSYALCARLRRPALVSISWPKSRSAARAIFAVSPSSRC